uniref:Arf-GAP with coiled-coil, ANK repeat and PH domain-containing protein n=1 Tax=Panthera tigris altaica TaxID=74533 RepID=A0A8C9KNE3_PANTA
MTVKLDFEECLKDSPRFRASIELVEAEVSELETRLEKLLKLGNGLLESGRHYLADERGAPLKTARAGDRGRALDYALQINVIEDKRKFDIMEFVLRLVEAQATHFQQGHEELGRLAQYRRDLGAQLHQLVLNSARERRDMEQRHVLLKQKELGGEEPEPSLKEGPGGLVMEGHLFKRASNAFKTWSRRWFTIQSNQLVYQKKYKDPVTVVVDDLRLCTVKLCPDSERRFCFEVVSPSKKAGQSQGRLGGPCVAPGINASVAGLGGSLGGEGAFRGRGWGDRGYLERWDQLVPNFYPAGISYLFTEKEAWIHAKYVEKKFLTKLPEIRGRRGGRGPPRGQPPVPPKPSSLNPYTPGSPTPPSHIFGLLLKMPPSLPACDFSLQNSLLACEFLLQNGANVNQTDNHGRGPLHHATILGHTGLACLFLKRGADLGALDSEGKDPLTIAMETANADIVTLLRLAKMREAEAAQGQAGN